MIVLMYIYIVDYQLHYNCRHKYVNFNWTQMRIVNISLVDESLRGS